MVARKSVCLRRAAGGKASQIVRYGRFLDHRKVTVASLIEGWGKQDGDCRGRGDTYWAIHDTSEINFRTTPGRRRGLGEIAKGNSYGVLLHPMLAIDAHSGDSLGLVHRRSLDPEQGRQVIAHDKRAASERESRRWVSTALAAKQVLSAASMVTVIGDRESDIYSAWAEVPEGGFHLLSRSMQDRAPARRRQPRCNRGSLPRCCPTRPSSWPSASAGLRDVPSWSCASARSRSSGRTDAIAACRKA